MLKVDNLQFGFSQNLLLNGVSFSVAQQQLWHVCGSNGSGKTTLMKLLLGLLKPTSGQITRESLQSLIYLPSEANGHYLKMDALSNLRLWLKLRGHVPSTEQLFHELDFWNLNHPLIRQKFPIAKFSTGMKRRLALARIKLSQTRLWLLDEPILGLDRNGCQQFRRMVDDHLQQQGSIILISHDVSSLKDVITNSIDLDQQNTHGAHQSSAI